MKQLLIGTDLYRCLLAWLIFAMPARSPAAEVFDLAERKAVTDFLRLPAGWSLGPCSAVSVNRQGEIFIFHRGDHPIIVCDAKGKYLRSWGDGLIGSAHGLRIDGNDDVWVTDTPPEPVILTGSPTQNDSFVLTCR